MEYLKDIMILAFLALVAIMGFLAGAEWERERHDEEGE